MRYYLVTSQNVKYNLFANSVVVYVETNYTLSEYQKGWLEAALDGEGSLYFVKNKDKTVRRGFVWKVIVNISNTNKAFLEKVRDICGGGTPVIPSKGKSPNWKPYWKQVYYWRMTNSQIEEILPQLDLIIKREHSLLILEVLNLLKEHSAKHTSNDAYLEQIYLDLKVLNK